MPFRGDEIWPDDEVFAVDFSSACVGGFHFLGLTVVEFQMQGYFQIVLLCIRIKDCSQPGWYIGSGDGGFYQCSDVFSECLDA